MILTRMGNKKKMVDKILPLIPQHKMWVELFFGAGGLFFNMPQAKYSIVNDLDDDVTNLYLVVLNNKAQLIKEIIRTPISQTLIRYWKKNRESDQVMKAVRFLMLSNFTYLGKGDTLRLGIGFEKKSILNKINACQLRLQNTRITSDDFRTVIPKISFSKDTIQKKDCFVYLDPIYHDTEYNYKVPKWTEKDTIDCFDLMQHSGIRCAMSEFDHPFIIEQANIRGFEVVPLCERHNIKNRRVEILIINYPKSQISLFQ